MRKSLTIHVTLFLLSCAIVDYSFDLQTFQAGIMMLFLAIVFSLAFILHQKQLELNLLKQKYKTLQKHEHLSVPYEALLGLEWGEKPNVELLKDFLSLHVKEDFKKLPLFEVIWRLKRLYEVEFLEENITIEIINEAKNTTNVKLNGLTYAIYILLHHKKMSAKSIKLHIFEKNSEIILDITSDTKPMQERDKGFYVAKAIIQEHKGEITTKDDGYIISFSQNK